MRYSLFFVFGIWCNLAFAELPSDYESFTGEQKQQILWKQIENTEWMKLPDVPSGGWNKILKLVRALTSLAPTFNTVSDELPKGRTKILHPRGSVAKISYEVLHDHAFTGIFQHGALGLARLSLAADPKAGPFIPGMALKFFIDGYSSLNLQVMNNLEGQGKNTNFFEEDFSNIIPPATGATLRFLSYIFSRTHNPPNHLPISHLAKRTHFGEPPIVVVEPYQLVFKPCSQVADLISDESEVDFRMNLLKVEAGSCLYEVYANKSPKDETFMPIGRIKTLSRFIASQYGDEVLFFKHHH